MQKRPMWQDSSDSMSLENRHTCTANLYQRYAAALLVYIKRHTTTPNDAEDLLTEVFIGALRADLVKFSADEQRAWLWTVARNKVNDYHRQRHRQPQVSLVALGERLGEDDLETQAIAHEEVAFLHQYMQRLSYMQQEVLQLRFGGGLRCTEIATLLNKREGTIRSIISRALNELRKHYQR
jgi:RNA polymerase sigma factor (sigma-70 family)